MTPTEAADIFNAAHPDPGTHLDVPPCTPTEHRWSEWDFNHQRTCEYRLCAYCGGMEQQWI